MLAFLGIVVMSRPIAGPLRKLGDTARHLGAGDNEQRIETKRKDEVGQRARAFAHMRDGIANRKLEIKRLACWGTRTNLPNRAQFLEGANVARLGGDEFAILLRNTPLTQARRIAASIEKSLEEPIQLADQSIDLGTGIGIAGFPAHAGDPMSVMSRAEVAMYSAKSQGNPLVVYEQSIDRSSQQSLSLLGELRHTIEGNEFLLYVQPKVALDSGHAIGAETLM